MKGSNYKPSSRHLDMNFEKEISNKVRSKTVCKILVLWAETKRYMQF
jgi:hypothetical protein